MWHYWELLNYYIFHESSDVGRWFIENIRVRSIGFLVLKYLLVTVSILKGPCGEGSSLRENRGSSPLTEIEVIEDIFFNRLFSSKGKSLRKGPKDEYESGFRVNYGWRTRITTISFNEIAVQTSRSHSGKISFDRYSYQQLPACGYR